MPRLWLFNPGHEEALARASLKGGYTPTALVRRMMHQLAPLMRYLAQQGDYILQPDATLQSATLLNHRAECIPAECYPTEGLQLMLWADEEHAQRLALRLATGLGLKLLPLRPISEEYLRLSHRQSATDFLSQYHSTLSLPPALIPRWIIPQGSEGDTRRALESVLAELGAGLVLKRPYTSSGRGVELYARPLDEERVRHALRHCYASGGISLEPWLERVQDWAAEYYVDAPSATVRYVGLSRFVTSADGAYLGNSLAPEAELYAQLSAQVGEAVLAQTIEAHVRYLQPLAHAGYTGYVGVDMMTYRDAEAGLCLHPCIEINVRATMGLLAHGIALALGQEAGRSVFRLCSYPRGGAMATYQGHLLDPAGYTPLIVPDAQAQFYAYLEHGYKPL